MAWIESYQTKRGTKWLICWRVNGKRKSKSAGFQKATANRLCAQIDDDIIQDKPILDSGKVANYCKEYLQVIEKTVKSRTAEIARTSLEPFIREFGARLIHEVRAEEIEKFKNRLLEFRNSNGINIIIRNLKTFFQFCVRSGYLKSNPAQSVKQFKVKPVARFLTREEFVKLYLASSKSLRRVLFVLFRTGMRRGEFLGVSPQDIGEQGVRIAGKTGPRLVPLDSRTRKVLTGIAGKWTVDGLESAFRMASQRARIGRIRLHDLRHTWASAYLKSGGTLADLRVLGGWTSLSMLQVYAHFQEHYLAERMVKVRL